MVIVEGHGWPIGVGVYGANRNEAGVAEHTFESLLRAPRPLNILGDTAYSSQPLTERLRKRFKVILTAKPKRHYVNFFHDGRRSRRQRRRWKVERGIAWLRNYHRLETRWDIKSANFLGFAQLACSMNLIEHAL